MSQLRHQQERLDELKIQVKIVGFDSGAKAKEYVKETQLPWPLLLDIERKLYTAYGMEKGSWWSISNPVAVARYVGLMLRGQKPGKPGCDVFQLGGDVLIDPDGIVRLHHVSAGPHDRPSPEEILGLVRK